MRSGLRWYTLSLPRDLDLETVTAALRPLAGRRGAMLAGGPPLVVLEAWGQGGDISWRLGAEHAIAGDVRARMGAQLRRLGIAPLAAPEWPVLTAGADLRLPRPSWPLRLDTAGAAASGLLKALGGLGKQECGVVQWLVGPSQRRGQPRAMPTDFSELIGLRPVRKVDATTARLWAEKTREPLFGCRGRIAAQAATPERAEAIIRALYGALKLTDSQYAGLRLGTVSAAGARKLAEVSSPLTWSCLLNAAELAALIGWPLTDDPAQELGLVGGHVNPVPAGLRLSADEAAKQPGERLLGESLHPAEDGDLVRVPIQTSLHHVHVVGPTGSGKSTLLTGLITADIAAGRGVLVLEPKGDLVTDILGRVPAHRRDDVVVIEPSSDRSIGINVLGGEREQAERRADQIVALLHELHGANFGPRTADVALHALITVSRLPDGTLVDVPVLLSNPAFRRRVLAAVSDPLVLGPFWAWYDALSDAERGQVVAPLLNKLRAFMSRDALRRMLGQAQPKFDLDELFTKRRVVLINVNKGALGPETSSLLGALILTQLWAAIQRRAAVPADKRHPVMVVIDEYQDYLHLPGVDLADALAQARGLGVGLTLAHQHLDQLSATQRAAILANARSRIVFRPATSDAKPLAASLGGGLTGDDLSRLKAFEACAQLLVDSQPTAPFSVRTRPLPPWVSDPAELRRASAERYGIDGAELDKALTERWQGKNEPPDGPIGVRRRRPS